MMRLISQVNELSRGEVGKTVKRRLKEFRNVNRADTSIWFSELCFCILAANAKGRVAYDIQKTLGVEGCISAPKHEVLRVIKAHNHRFHNNKTNFILAAREHLDIKDKVKRKVDKYGQFETREWLAKSIRGIGYKEASHFLRNTGHNELAILDRHIINIMAEHDLIEKPNALTTRNYLRVEKKFIELAEAARMFPGELDLYLWQMKTGEVMK